MAIYLVEGLGDHRGKAETVVGLEAAKHRAERRALQSERPIVVRDAATGEEVARFYSQDSSRPPGGEAKVSSDAFIKLREANARLQRAVAPLPKRKKADDA